MSGQAKDIENRLKNKKEGYKDIKDDIHFEINRILGEISDPFIHPFFDARGFFLLVVQFQRKL